MKLQFRIALRRTTDISEEYLTIIGELIGNKLINEITVTGVNSDDLIAAEINLKIDWAIHEAQIKMGIDKISFNPKWNDYAIIELDEVIKLFLEFTREGNLTNKWSISWVDEISEDKKKRIEHNKKYGFVEGKRRKWVGSTSEKTINTEELPELTARVVLPN